MQAFSEVTLCSRALINPNLNSKFPEEVKKIEAPELGPVSYTHLILIASEITLTLLPPSGSACS